jgi:hypothetical protein
MDNFIFTHLDICHLDSEWCVCVAAAETAMPCLVTSEYSVSDIQHYTHVHVCNDVKPAVVTAMFTDWLITVIKIYGTFLYIGCVNDTVAIFCLFACASSFIEADNQ